MTLGYKNEETVVPDLGGDKIWRIGDTDAPGNYSIHELIAHPKGTGPRHMAVLGCPGVSQRHLSLPRQCQHACRRRPHGHHFCRGRNSSPGALHRIPAPYIYVSNLMSNLNIGATPDPRGDTIGIFDPGELAPVNQAYTGLVNIRGMELGLGDDGEAYLVALGAVSGGMAVYECTQGGAALQEIARNASAVAGTTLVMLQS
ncbi:hypothetical protein B0H13DRAFT_752702 [Mycena leptocephala]|nr:hypothetical protein B0H13DRAFT_752702 [Mycena leptocephala]